MEKMLELLYGGGGPGTPSPVTSKEKESRAEPSCHSGKATADSGSEALGPAQSSSTSNVLRTSPDPSRSPHKPPRTSLRSLLSGSGSDRLRRPRRTAHELEQAADLTSPQTPSLPPKRSRMRARAFCSSIARLEGESSQQHALGNSNLQNPREKPQEQRSSPLLSTPSPPRSVRSSATGTDARSSDSASDGEDNVLTTAQTPPITLRTRDNTLQNREDTHVLPPRTRSATKRRRVVESDDDSDDTQATP